MDSVSQLALGAAVGHAILGRRIGRVATLWGAALGTLPDLDVFVPMGDAVANFTYHRSWSHSLWVLAAISWPIALLLRKTHPRARVSRRSWLVFVYAVFATHVLLDSFTVYGTQILWPLPIAPECWSTVFIIDPLYTLPLLVGTGAAIALQRRKPERARAWNIAGLALSTLYLGWTVYAKLRVERAVELYLARTGTSYEQVLTTPAPFQSLLWRIVVMHERGYSEGFYSLVADGDDVDLTRYPSAVELLEPMPDHGPVLRLRWFTHGFMSVSRLGDEVLITDLRMGFEPEYVFRFVVGKLAFGEVLPTTPRGLGMTPSLARLPWVWRRIWDRNAE